MKTNIRTHLSTFQDRSYDVVVIGGGINGSSAAQHLAADGYDVLLVDKGDFAMGATSRSSRLLHCGLRYLAPGRSVFDFLRYPNRLATALRMARLAMQARAELVDTSAIRTRAMDFVFPVYKNGVYRGLHLDAAFGILKMLGPSGGPPLDYKRLTPDEAKGLPLARWLGRFEQLESVVTFREYQMDWPERLCIDNVMDAERLGAQVRNYTSARLLSRDSNGWLVGLTDMLEEGAEYQVTAKIVLNMAGVWIDGINRNAAPKASRKIQGTKGAHIVVKLPDECRNHGIAAINSKNEPFYCVPWRGWHYIGPTETLYEGDLDDVYADDNDIDWLVREANEMLPGAAIQRSDVVFTWAGVRPLTYDETTPLGKRSREIHDLSADGLPGVYAMTMGSVMNHRSGGRDMARLVSKKMASRRPAQKPSYASAAIFNSTQSTEQLALEHAVSLSDAVFRRTGLGWDAGLSPDAQHAALYRIARQMGWGDARVEDEIAAFLKSSHHLYGPAWNSDGRPVASESMGMTARNGLK